MKARVLAVAVVALMSGAFAAAEIWRPTVKLADQRPKITLETAFPKSFAGWAVDDRVPVQLVSPDTEALLSKIYNQTLSRTYVNAKGQRIMLSVAYGGDQSDATRAHRPEVCYPAQGFQIMNSVMARAPIGAGSIPVRRLVAKSGGRVEPITYWIVVGEQITVTGTEQKLAQLGYGMRGVIPDGMLVRVSSIDTDQQAAFNLQQEFIAGMAGNLPPATRAQVVGTGH